MKRVTLSALLCILFTVCASARQLEVSAEIVTPAGSAIYFDSNSGTPQNYRNENAILYLPFPANLGVIHSDNEGPQLHVLILSPAFESGFKLGIIPVGIFEIKESGITQNIILAIPADPKLQVIKSPTLDQLRLNYSGVIEILEIWITNHKGENSIDIKALYDEQTASEILNTFLN